jgi:hypothetical protein
MSHACTAYLCAKIDTRTLKTLTVGIYSSPADRLCVIVEHERFIDLAQDNTFSDSFQRNALRLRASMKNLQWSAPLY